MKASKFFPSLADVNNFLVQIDLVADYITNPSYPLSMPATIRQLNYQEGWRLSRKSRWYNFLLEDQSLLQYRLLPYPSYSYLECPYSAKTLDGYAIENYGPEWEMFYADILEEYEQYLDMKESNKPVTPVRYDFDVDCYKPGRHPAAHMHFGIDNNVRIALERQLTPLSFAMFIIRQFYPEKWAKFILSPKNSSYLNEIRDNLITVPKKYMGKLEQHEMRLV